MPIVWPRLVDVPISLFFQNTKTQTIILSSLRSLSDHNLFSWIHLNAVTIICYKSPSQFDKLPYIWTSIATMYKYFILVDRPSPELASGVSHIHWHFRATSGGWCPDHVFLSQSWLLSRPPLLWLCHALVLRSLGQFYLQPVTNTGIVNKNNWLGIKYLKKQHKTIYKTF